MPSFPSKSIAVLPFVSLSTQEENELFCDGMTEDIINALSKIEQLKVTSRTSSFYFKDKAIPLPEIAEALDVVVILEGSVRLHQQKLRVNAQLIDVESDTQLWTETWNRNLEDIFDVQDEISLSIADKIREYFGHLDYKDELSEAVTHNLDAYEHCLRGKALFSKWNPEHTNLAIAHFEKAIELDPQFIEAQVGLADAYSFLAVAGFAPREEAWSKSIRHIELAKAIDIENAPLNYLLANQAFFTEADYAEAMRFAGLSLANKPNYSEAIQFMSFLYMLKDDEKKAKEYLLYAKSIDPFNLETKFYEAYFYYRFNQHGRAEQLLRELLEVNKQNLPAIITLSYVYLKQGKYNEAEEILQSVPPEMIMPDEQLGLSCIRYALSGNLSALSSDMPTLEQHAAQDNSFQAHAYLYILYACLGRNDEAFQILEKLFEVKSSILLLNFGDPLAESIQSDPRYLEYHERIYRIKLLAVKPKTNSSAMDASTAHDYMSRLDEYIDQEKPYLNPSLSLRSLAEQLEMPPNQLSWLLNEKTGKNFNTYINQFRTEHFKTLLQNPKNSHISLIGLAYESGFNSKTVFNTFFKKETGMTPKSYLKSISQA